MRMVRRRNNNNNKAKRCERRNKIERKSAAPPPQLRRLILSMMAVQFVRLLEAKFQSIPSSQAKRTYKKYISQHIRREYNTYSER